MVQCGVGSSSQSNSGVWEWLDCQSQAMKGSFSSHSPCSFWGKLPLPSASHQMWPKQRHSHWWLTYITPLFCFGFYCPISLDHWPCLLDWSKIWRVSTFLVHEALYLYSWLAWQLLHVPAAGYCMLASCYRGHNCLLCAPCPCNSGTTHLAQVSHWHYMPTGAVSACQHNWNCHGIECPGIF